MKERPETFAAALGSGLFATAATILFYVAIIGAASPALLASVGVPAASAAAAALALGWVVGDRRNPSAVSHPERRHPLDIRAVLKLGAFISVLLALTAVVKSAFGAQALDLVSFVGGLFELHSVSFANATLHAAGGITKDEATKALLLALGASFVSKLAISWVLAFGRFALAMTGLLAVVAGTAGVIFMLLRP